jgi:hypothetical protein
MLAAASNITKFQATPTYEMVAKRLAHSQGILEQKVEKLVQISITQPIG